MSTLIKRSGYLRVYSKGAADIMLNKCTQIMRCDGGVEQL